MLKKIPVSQLRIGMHLHKLEGPWMAHPFWKTRFVIESGDDLHRLHGSGLEACWIDTRLGLDVATPQPNDAPPAAFRAPAAPAANADSADSADAANASPPASPPPAERPLAAEQREAAAICARGRAAVTAMFAEARMGHTLDAERCMPLVEDIMNSVQRNCEAIVGLARLKRHDDYSYMHSVAVCALMVALERQLGGDVQACREAGAAGLLHDIGKAVMPLALLNKPGRLSESEFEIVRGHAASGHALLQAGKGASPQTLDVALHHHERMDGSGYPHGLAGEHISRIARMGAICDVYDAITSNRPYKAGWDPAESIARMASWKGHFDGRLFAAFVQSLGIYPTGSLVRLASGRLAVVSEQNPTRLVAPRVTVFYSLRTQLRTAPQRVDLAADGCNDRIVGRATEAYGQFPGLEQLWADAGALRHMSL
jgi:HD-GYP domain-containing protein (c-di-GMP phosphodiesterase class II)